MEVTAFAPLLVPRRWWRARPRRATIADKAIAFPIWGNCTVARTGRPATRPVAAVQRAIAILDELAAARTELGTNEIARRTGINVSTISRILATLAGGGLVDHVPPTGRYWRSWPGTSGRPPRCRCPESTRRSRSTSRRAR